MYYYRLLKTRWGMVAYVARNHKLVKIFLPPGLPNGAITGPEETRQSDFQRAEIDAYALKKKITITEDPNLLEPLATDLRDYYAGRPVKFRHQPDLDALTPFTQTVLKLAAQIPYGRTTCYSDLAVKAGNPRAVRAVARALAGNPVPLVIPCHRVLYRDGTIGGFSAPGGPPVKVKMLELETIVLLH